MTKYPVQEFTTYPDLTTSTPYNLISGVCQEQAAMTTFFSVCTQSLLGGHLPVL